ncbi:MAG TPA: MmgE/PrpD family protein, partial [Mesorhizobium sp.]|nr:MmgE/PrpD family protein [Mesorhizobium sp.]
MENLLAPADTIARTLSGFANRMRLDQVPVEVSLRARHLILDAIGCALAARHEEFATRYARATHALSEGQGKRVVIGFSKRLAQRDAALLNGVLCHGLDYDDTHMTGIIHLTVSVLPTVLSLAGQRGASGADMLAAYIAGVETGARIASATRGGLHAHGFHPTA